MQESSKKLRILMLNYEFPPLGGGAANATFYLLKEFSRHSNLEIHLVTSSVHKAGTKQFSPNIFIHFLDIGKKSNLHYQNSRDLLVFSFKALMFSRKFIRQNQVDQVHAFFGIPCGFLAMFLGKPYIVSLRGSDVPGYSARFALADRLVFSRLSRIIWKKADQVVANSQGLKDLALRSSPKQDIVVIPNGVDAKSFETLQEFMRNGKLNLLFVGRLIPRKGLNYLLEAMQGLKSVGLTVVGGGPMRAEMEKAASGMDVHFTGPMPHEDLKSFYSKHDVFVLPSLNEGMSNTVLEAMAAGLPLIVTDTGGTRELVKGNGFVVPGADQQAIRDSILKFINDPGLLKTMGGKSRNLALGMSWDRIAGMYAQVFRQVLQTD